MTTPDDPNAGTPAPDHGATPPPQQPAYYGQPYYYGPPAPQSPPSRAAWFAIGAGSMFGVVLLGAFGFFAFFGWALGDDYDDLADQDGSYYVEQSAVIDAVDQPCVAMQDAANNIKLIGGLDEGAASLRAFSTSIGAIVTAIDGAKPNKDAKAWRDDWAKIATSVDTYTAALAAGQPAELKLPRVATGPIINRMYGGVEGCELPMRVAVLDKDLTDEYYGY